MPLPHGLRTDVPVLVAVLVCWLTLPVLVAHVLTGLAMACLIAVHLRTRWPKVRRQFRLTAPTLRRTVNWIFLATTAAMLVSGVLRWIGVAPQYAQHATASYLMLTAVVVHMVVIRRALWARLRARPAAVPRSARAASAATRAGTRMPRSAAADRRR